MEPWFSTLDAKKPPRARKDEIARGGFSKQLQLAYCLHPQLPPHLQSSWFLPEVSGITFLTS